MKTKRTCMMMLSLGLVLSIATSSMADVDLAAAVNYGAGDGPSSVAIGDLNGDTHPDLAVANQYSDNVSVLLGNGDGTFIRSPRRC